MSRHPAWLVRVAMTMGILANLFVGLTAGGWWLLLHGGVVAALTYTWWTWEARWGNVCRRRGHDWLLDGEIPPQFLPRTDFCLRCGTRRVALPIERCLAGHPLAEHYDAEGNPVEHPTCKGPL